MVQFKLILSLVKQHKALLMVQSIHKIVNILLLVQTSTILSKRGTIVSKLIGLISLCDGFVVLPRIVLPAYGLLYSLLCRFVCFVLINWVGTIHKTWQCHLSEMMVLSCVNVSVTPGKYRCYLYELSPIS